MARTIAGTLNVPDTGPLANAEIFFVAKRNEATKILQGVSSVITTNGSGDYSQSIEDGYYAVSLRFDDGSGNQLHRYALGEVFIQTGDAITLNALLATNDSIADPTEAALQQLLADAQQARDDAVAAAAKVPNIAAGDSLKFLRVKEDETGNEYVALGSAAHANVMSSLTDTTAGRMQLVGAFGNGIPLIGVSRNLFSYVNPGKYVLPSGSPGEFTNLPAGAEGSRGVLDVSGGVSAGYQLTVFTDRVNRVRYFAVYAGGWSAWQKIYSQESILGTVSQSSGVPTGAVIESGSNANGQYMKLAGGWAILKMEVGSIDITTARGALFSSDGDTAPYPVSPLIGATGYVEDPGSALIWGAVTAGSSSAGVYLWYTNSITGRSARVVVIGRWY